MNCVRCGDSDQKHCRADGACMACGCPKMQTSWIDTEEEEQPVKVHLEAKAPTEE